tara:strand:+ start:21057 stop:22400 length:1344 start_codon:yes stop_codon:yes gene_type:complete
MSVVVQLSKFEGPLALLLYLIRKDEMDIFDIKINEITTQYLDYIKLMKELDLEVAGEFVAMAATLIQIKSKMLLPQYDEKGEIIESEDPRKELVQKLLEYQKYQEAARLLYERPLVGRDMWTRGVRLNLDEPSEEIEVEENGLFQMISLYRQIMRSAKKRIHQVTAKAQSIASRILEIKDLLTVGSRKTLNDLIGETENRMRQVLITFLSVLELAKLGFVGLYQTETYGDLWIDLKKPIEKDVVSAVEEYGSIDNKADSLFEKAEADAAAEIVASESEDFVLVDAEDRLEEDESAQLSLEDMATDDEILQAEMELAGEVAEVAIDTAIIDEVKADIIDDMIAEETVAEGVLAEATEESEIAASETEVISEVAEQMAEKPALLSADEMTSIESETAVMVEDIATDEEILQAEAEAEAEIADADEAVMITEESSNNDHSESNGEPEAQV